MKERIYRVCAKAGIQVFSKVFPEYFAREPLKPSDRYIEYNFAIKHIQGEKVLDVGCAGSLFPLMLSAFGYCTWGMDIREYAITNKLSFPKFDFIKEDIKTTTLRDEFFDTITSISTIEHIGISGRYGEKDDDRGDLKAVDQMKRMLKRNGVLILTLPFGKPKVIKPYCRIYGSTEELSKGMIVEEKEFYAEDGDWIKCTEEETFKYKATPDKSPICLLKMRKP